MKTLQYRGTTINVIENEWWTPSHNMGDLFNEDFLFVSNGFLSAVNNGLVPVEVISVLDKNKSGEWHHIFVKQEDGSFQTSYVKFENN